MAHNFLEQLVAEWYEYQGYFIRRNMWVGKRAKGGYECELDIIAFHPETKHLVQIEPSMDAASWDEREKRYKKKFEAGKKYIPELFKGLDIPKKIEQIAVLVFASKENRDTVGGGKLILISELLKDVFTELRSRSIYSEMVSEQFAILRGLQFVAQYSQDVCAILLDREV
jgi:hypothetical protein